MRIFTSEGISLLYSVIKEYRELNTSPARVLLKRNSYDIRPLFRYPSTVRFFFHRNRMFTKTEILSQNSTKTKTNFRSISTFSIHSFVHKGYRSTSVGFKNKLKCQFLFIRKYNFNEKLTFVSSILNCYIILNLIYFIFIVFLFLYLTI